MHDGAPVHRLLTPLTNRPHHSNGEISPLRLVPRSAKVREIDSRIELGGASTGTHG